MTSAGGASARKTRTALAFATLTGAAFALFVVVGGSEDTPPATDADGSSHSNDDDDDVLLPKEIERQARSGQVRRPIRGTSFPDGVLALTWDDGPDSVTIDLAKYLRKENVTATFFAVGGWSAELSMEPGTGANVFETGYERMATVLPELTRLGHRVGGHTAHHALLTDLPLLDVDKEIAPSLEAARAASKGSEVTFFRAPGGAWSDDVGRIAADLDFVGPIHWDIDAKDWDSSLYCRSSPKEECEPSPIQGETRVRADVIARRYLAQIESSRHGIVLFHDRVGHVGSRYALDLAKALIPALVKRGFVFASPLLSFGPWASRLPSPDRKPARGLALAGAGDALACVAREGRLACHRAVPANQAAPLSFAKDMSPAIDLRFDPDKADVAIADLDGDHHADACALDAAATTVRCVLSKASAVVTLEGARWDAFALGDVDGDGLADACGHALEGSGIWCAKSNGASLAPPRPWIGGENAIASVTERELRLADLDGDHRADICGPKGCALSTGTSFDKDHAWPPPSRSTSDGGMAALFVNGASRDTPGSGTLLRLGDVNGDGRADLCAIAGAERALFCALSDGHGWKRATLWASLPQGPLDEQAPSLAFELADINGDGRADVCALTSEGVSCAMAP